ncbi:hypothetical protein BDC45DRAFT_122333 [Circinella umbellata]|nr:hypothetical protein BDC45DRAFT_122333 [Circinella umbellata]
MTFIIIIFCFFCFLSSETPVCIEIFCVFQVNKKRGDYRGRGKSVPKKKVQDCYYVVSWTLLAVVIFMMEHTISRDLTCTHVYIFVDWSFVASFEKRNQRKHCRLYMLKGSTETYRK